MAFTQTQTQALEFSEAEVAGLRAAVLSDTPAGFEIFYALVYNRPLAPHALAWIESAYDARVRGLGLLVEAFRGSTKTTTFNAFDLYRIGLEPQRSNMLIMSGDDAANRNTSDMAGVIADNPGWKLCFPNVVPDRDVAWGAAGYENKRADADYGEWRRRRGPDPTIVGYGYQSRSIIGKHPDGVLRLDDIHNEENTSSTREMERVFRTLTDTIMPTRAPNNPWTIVIGTPWTENDALQKLKATGEFVCLRTPVYLPDNVTPTWPAGFPEERIRREKALDITGGVSFARMFLLDLAAAQNRVYSYQTWSADKIEWGWPHYGGVDYAAVIDPSKATSKHSHFALAYVAENPAGWAVVVDGVLEQVDMERAETHVLTAQRMFPNWRWATVELYGRGQDFYMSLSRHPELLLNPGNAQSRKSKAQRLYDSLGPLLRIGRLKISDQDSKFLNALRHWLNMYPNVEEHDPGWDAADAVYWAATGIPGLNVMPKLEDEMPELRWGPKKREQSPWAAFGQQEI